jgi:4-amino-4-deoxy-L-arabinose transferase-like glycosyltransferase
MQAEDTLALKQRTPTKPVNERAWRALLRDPWAWAVIVVGAWLIGRCIADTFAVVNLDEGAFLTIAQEILRGRLPYRDVFDQKGPAIYYLLAGILALTSHLSLTAQIVTARVVAVSLNLLTALGIIFLGKRWWRLEVGVLAALLWLFALPAYLGDSVLTEPFATAPVVWAVVLVARRADRRSACGAGLLIALGSLFKQTAVLAAPGVAFILLAQTAQERARWRVSARQVATIAALALGTLVPWLVIGALFAAAGGLQPMINQVLWANIHYPADSFETVKNGLLVVVAADPLIPLLPPLIIGVGLARWLPRPGHAPHAPGLGTVGVTLLYVFNLAPFFAHAYPHYWLPVAPWAALLAALGLVTVFGWMQPRMSAALASLSRLSVIQAMQTRMKLRRLFVALLLALIVLAGAGSIDATFQARCALLQPQLAAGAWIARYTPPGARLLIAPAEPEYYYLSGQLPVTAYIYIFPVNSSPALLAEVSDQLRTRRFNVVVWEDVSAPIYLGIRQQLFAHYHAVAADATEHLTLYLPNQPDGQNET